jgi:hypothetical protein
MVKMMKRVKLVIENDETGDNDETGENDENGKNDISDYMVDMADMMIMMSD